jgi:hypothetical protein
MWHCLLLSLSQPSLTTQHSQTFYFIVFNLPSILFSNFQNRLHNDTLQTPLANTDVVINSQFRILSYHSFYTFSNGDSSGSAPTINYNYCRLGTWFSLIHFISILMHSNHYAHHAINSIQLNSILFSVSQI